MKENNAAYRNEKTELIIGRNAVKEIIRSGRRTEEILLNRSGDAETEKIAGAAAEKDIPVKYVEKRVLDRLARGGVHQGVIAYAEGYRYSSVADIIGYAQTMKEEPFVIILDGIEDPHNLGAIIRTAECAGAHGVIIPKRRSAEINETVMKTSAGAASHVLCARVTNLPRTIEELKKAGIWVAAADMGGRNIYESDLTGPVAVVIGNEGKGISRLAGEKCDFTVSVPLRGRISSLNASNAAAVVMYEIRRQRDGKQV